MAGRRLAAASSSPSVNHAFKKETRRGAVRAVFLCGRLWHDGAGCIVHQVQFPGGVMRALAFAVHMVAMGAPASARLGKPTPQQQTIDYLTINHNKSGESVVMVWMASPLVSAPTIKPLLERYIVLSIAHTRRAP